MKRLVEYINNHDFENYLSEELAFHISADLKFRYPVFSIQIYESYLFESLGRFDNCVEVAEFAAKEIRKNPVKQIIDCSKFKVFFKNINIKKIIFENDFYSAYTGKGNKDSINIELSIPKEIGDDPIKYEERIMYILVHEFLHAYEDYQRLKNGKPSIFNYFDDEYIKSYSKIKSVFDLNKMTARCKYFLNDQERNAYFSELYPMVEKIIKDKKITKENIKYDELVNEIKNTDLWKIYFEIGDFIIKVKNDAFSENDKKDIIDMYSHIIGKKSTYKEIIKDFTNKWNKFYSKFNQLVPKIICDIILKEPYITGNTL